MGEVTVEDDPGGTGGEDSRSRAGAMHSQGCPEPATQSPLPLEAEATGRRKRVCCVCAWV